MWKYCYTTATTERKVLALTPDAVECTQELPSVSPVAAAIPATKGGDCEQG